MTPQEQASNLLDKLDDPTLRDSAAVIQGRDPMEELKTEVLSFFKNRIASIQKSEELKALVYDQLTSEIQGGSLTFDQLLTVLSRLDHGANESADSIISMFRPTSNGQSSLAEIIRPNSHADEVSRAFAAMSSEDLRAVNETMKHLRVIAETRAKTDVDNGSATTDSFGDD